jgi:hypothetical protein
MASISEPNLELSQFKTLPNLETKCTYLTLYNKETVYGYIIEELAEYCKIVQIMGLDKNYIKSIRKRKIKEPFMCEENQKKIIDAIVEFSTNKDIKCIIKQYEQNYKIYK